jgi:hypothetical protein
MAAFVVIICSCDMDIEMPPVAISRQAELHLYYAALTWTARRPYRADAQV